MSSYRASLRPCLATSCSRQKREIIIGRGTRRRAVFKKISKPIRVVVTGVGAITGQGPSADDLWEGSRAGRVAIREMEHVPMEGYGTKLGGEVKDKVAPQHDYMHPDGYHEPVIDFALKAAEEAVEQC